MSGLAPAAFLTFEGESIPGRVPPRLIVRGRPLNKGEQGAVAHLYREFARQSSLALGPYRISDLRLADGLRVRLESNHGVDRVTVWPEGAGQVLYDIRPLMVFASAEAALGVDAEGTQAANMTGGVRSVSQWRNPPLPALGDYAMRCAHGVRQLSTYNSGIAANETVLPGNVDWYDPREDSPHYGFVLTWWNLFAGRYSRADGSGIYADSDHWIDDAWLNKYSVYGPGAVAFDADNHLNVSTNLIWCNGLVIAKLNSSMVVLGACLAKNGAGQSELRVLLSYDSHAADSPPQVQSTYVLARGVVDLEQLRNANQHALVRFTTSTSYTIAEINGTLVQPAHCNASGTRAVMLFAARDGKTLLNNTALHEIDMSTGARSAVAMPWTVNAEASMLDAGIGTTVKTTTASGNTAELSVSNPSRVYTTTVTQTHDRTLEATRTLCTLRAVDYEGDTLVYVYTEDILRASDTLTTSLTMTTEISESCDLETDSDGAQTLGLSLAYASDEDDTLTEQWDARFEGEFRFVHNVLGVLKSFAYGTCYSVTRSGYATIHHDGTEPREPYGWWFGDENGTIDSNFDSSYQISFIENRPYPIQWAGLRGDLRVQVVEPIIAYDNDADTHRNYATLWRQTGSWAQTRTVDSAEQRIYSPDKSIPTQLTNGGHGYTFGADTVRLVERTLLVGATEHTDLGIVAPFRNSGPTEDLRPDNVTVDYGIIFDLSNFFLTADTVPPFTVVSSSSSSSGNTTTTTYTWGLPQPAQPDPQNIPVGVYDMGCTSSFDGRLYYRSLMAGSTGSHPYSNYTDNGGTTVKVPLISAEQAFIAELRDPATGELVLDLNADATLNPCPGANKTCTTFLFLGPVRDDQSGRYNNLPSYLKEK